MAFPLDATYTVALAVTAVGGLAIAALPRLNAMRRPHRLRSKLKQDLEILSLASQASLDTVGIDELREFVDSSAIELMLYERLRQDESLERRRAFRIAAPSFALTVSAFGSVSVAFAAINDDTADGRIWLICGTIALSFGVTAIMIRQLTRWTSADELRAAEKREGRPYDESRYLYLDSHDEGSADDPPA